VGQMIDVAQFDCMVAYNTAITGYTLSGMKTWELRKKYPMGRGRGSGLTQTKDGGWIMLAGFNPRAMDNLKKLFGVEEITRDLIVEKIGEMERDEAVDFFVNAGIPVGPVYHVDEVVEDPHLLERGMLVEVEHPKAGKIKVPNFPVKLSETPGEIKTTAPLLGQDNREVFTGILGYTEEKIKELEKKGVIFTET